MMLIIDNFQSMYFPWASEDLKCQRELIGKKRTWRCRERKTLIEGLQGYTTLNPNWQCAMCINARGCKQSSTEPELVNFFIFFNVLWTCCYAVMSLSSPQRATLKDIQMVDEISKAFCCVWVTHGISHPCQVGEGGEGERGVQGELKSNIAVYPPMYPRSCFTIASSYDK